MNTWIVCCRGRSDLQECYRCDPTCFCIVATDSFKENSFFLTLVICSNDSGEYRVLVSLLG